MTDDTPPARKSDMQRYAWIVAAVLSAGAGGGGFIGAAQQSQKLREDVSEIKSDIRVMNNSLGARGERITVLEFQYQALSRDIDKLREAFEAGRETRRR